MIATCLHHSKVEGEDMLSQHFIVPLTFEWRRLEIGQISHHNIVLRNDLIMFQFTVLDTRNPQNSRYAASVVYGRKFSIYKIRRSIRFCDILQIFSIFGLTYIDKFVART
jgi:hypothetical protein